MPPTPSRKSKTTSRRLLNEMSSLPKGPEFRTKNRGGPNRNAFKTGGHLAELCAPKAGIRCVIRQARQAIALAPGGIASGEI